MNPMEQWLSDADKAMADEKKAERANRPKGQKCSNCLHHRGHPFSPKYHYCSKGTSKHTGCGMAKTNPGGWCKLWEVQP